MSVACYVRVSTSRQYQQQTLDQQLRRLRGDVATHPTWPVAAENLYRDDCYSEAHSTVPVSIASGTGPLWRPLHVS